MFCSKVIYVYCLLSLLLSEASLALFQTVPRKRFLQNYFGRQSTQTYCVAVIQKNVLNLVTFELEIINHGGMYT